MVTRWTFQDLSTSEIVTLPINPKDGGSPSFSKHINYSSTAAPDGKTLVFEGLDDPQTLEWSGTILDQTHYELLRTWYSKRHQIVITDDLGRQFTCYITKYTPKRKRSVQHPYKHDYDMSATILDWA